MDPHSEAAQRAAARRHQQQHQQPAVLGAADVDEAFERWLMMTLSAQVRDSWSCARTARVSAFDWDAHSYIIRGTAAQHCNRFVGRVSELKILTEIGRGLKFEPVVVVTGPRARLCPPVSRLNHRAASAHEPSQVQPTRVPL